MAGCGTASSSAQEGYTPSPPAVEAPAPAYPDGETTVPIEPAPPPPPVPEQGGNAGGLTVNSCDARTELNGSELSVYVQTDAKPPQSFYSGYLADDQDGNAVGRMYRGIEFSFNYREVGGAIVFIAVDAATLPSGTLSGPSGTLPPGYSYLWCGTMPAQ